ncbi:MAG: class I tRNA ligase family protein [Pirellulaceae bacterium]
MRLREIANEAQIEDATSTAGNVPRGESRDLGQAADIARCLPYANGPIHLGHLVEYIQTDIWVLVFKIMRASLPVRVRRRYARYGHHAAGRQRTQRIDDR